MHIKKEFSILLLALAFFFLSFSFSFAENIDSVKKWAWGDQLGWVNFNPTLGDVRVFDSSINGSFWVENVGWVNLTPTSGGVLNNNGILSGSAWGENIGWVDFSSVAIDPNTGVFSGTATTDSWGDINFTGDNVSVKTFWRGDSIDLNSGNEKRFRGYAWSDSIGWISMNCSNTKTCGHIDYGVDVDSTGKVFGLAWSDHAGWLDLSYYNNAYLDMSTGVLSGDAQFLSALAEDDEWTGKVSLSGSSPEHSPILDFSTYEFDGFAWGSSVVGWIDFKTSTSVVTLDPFRFFFTANKGLRGGDEVIYNGSVVLSWVTEGASSCRALDGGDTNWTETTNKPVGEPTSASQTISGLVNDTTFVLRCMDSSGKEIERELNILTKPAAPIVVLTASDENVAYNTKSNLSWVAENVSSCQASGDWTGSKAVGSNSELTSNLTNSVNVFYLECVSDSSVDYPDPVSDSVQVEVEKLVLDFYPEQNPVPYGDKIKLYWNVEFATSCVASGDLPGFSGQLTFSDGEHEFVTESPETEEGKAYFVSIMCEGQMSQTETKNIQFRVGKNPVYKEN